MYSMSFRYDSHGFGSLCLFDDDNVKVMEYAARTGSIRLGGEVHDLLPAKTYWLKDLPVDTIEDNMHFSTPGNGWKCRLYDPGYTHYLIHPIQHGTLGCIGLISTDGLPLKAKLAEILQQQTEIELTVERI